MKPRAENQSCFPPGLSVHHPCPQARLAPPLRQNPARQRAPRTAATKGHVTTFLTTIASPGPSLPARGKPPSVRAPRETRHRMRGDHVAFHRKPTVIVTWAHVYVEAGQPYGDQWRSWQVSLHGKDGEDTYEQAPGRSGETP